MALTASEYLGTVVPGFVTDGSGNLVLTTEPAAEVFGTVIPGFLTDADGRLVATYTPATEIRTKVPGFVTDAAGRLAIATEVSSPVYTQVPGFLTNADGYLSVQETPTSGVFVTGFIRDTDGALGVGSTYVASPYEAAVMDLTPSIFLPLTKTAPLTDLSGNARNGTAGGGLTAGGYTPGPLAAGDNGATNFDGINDKVTTTYDPFVNATTRTFMGWAYRDSAAANGVLFSAVATADAAAAWVRIIATSGDVQFSFLNSPVATWTAAWASLTTTWVHWAVVVDEPNDTITLYLNGALVSAKTSAIQWGGPYLGFQLGVRAAASDPFDGKMAWVSVHESALTGPQILAAYTEGTI